MIRKGSLTYGEVGGMPCDYIMFDFLPDQLAMMPKKSQSEVTTNDLSQVTQVIRVPFKVCQIPPF